MKFTKMHGCGNDYVYVSLFDETVDNPKELSIAVSDRHFGIGSDGLITMGPSRRADWKPKCAETESGVLPNTYTTTE